MVPTTSGNDGFLFMRINVPSFSFSFSFDTLLSVTKSKGYNVDLSSDLFKCRLEVLHYETAPRRAFFYTGLPSIREWPCGRGADAAPQRVQHLLRISKVRTAISAINYAYEVTF